MTNRVKLTLLVLSCLGLAATPCRAQSYTQDNIASYLIPIQGWNMNQVGGRNLEQYVATGSLPSPFDYTKIVGIFVVILSDPNSSGHIDAITPLVKLYIPESTSPSESGGGGNYSLECNTYPYCYLELDRGADNYSYFQNTNYDNSAVTRGYLKLDYLK